PSSDDGLGLTPFAAIQPPQKFASAFARSNGSHGGARKRFNGIAAQKLMTVLIEEIAGSKNIDPSDFTAVSVDHADHVLAFEAGRRIGEAALHFGNEIIDGDA